MPFSPPEHVSMLLLPLSKIYGGAVNMRNWGYSSDIMKAKHLPKPVISVGNITVGGTGKTPVTRFLSELLNQSNQQVAILTRGYGRIARETIILNRENLSEVPFSRTGDEPRLLARSLKNGAVFIDPDRRRAGELALSTLNPDVFVLDDGFQHRGLNRDLDIVTIDAAKPFGNGRLLPSGPLREPVDQLKRADLLWITRVNESGLSIDQIRSQLRQFMEKPMVFSQHEATYLLRPIDQSRSPVGEIEGKRVVAFCGIANPGSFRNTLETAGAKIAEFIRFSDHHIYKSGEIRRLEDAMSKTVADLILTTEKDVARFSPEFLSGIPDLHVMEINISLLSGENFLKNSLKNVGIV